MSKKSRKRPGNCAFCGAGNLSKEHIWPQWAFPFVRTHDASGSNISGFFVQEDKTLVSKKVKERQGDVTTTKIRAVCARCNNGWMNEIEGAMQRVAAPLILGRPATITLAMQTVIAQWLTLKVMVGEHSQRNPAEVVIPQSARQAFKDQRIIPACIRLWIARCVSNRWRSGYLRHSALLSDNVSIVPNNGRKNVQTTAIGIGELFSYAMVSVSESIQLHEFFRISDRLVPLWPPQGGDIIWPPSTPINERAADTAALALDTLMKSPGVGWRPIPV